LKEVRRWARRWGGGGGEEEEGRARRRRRGYLDGLRDEGLRGEVIIDRF